MADQLHPDQVAAFIQQQVEAQVAAQLAANAPVAAAPARRKPLRPDTFNGNTASANLDLWLFQVEEYLEASNIHGNADRISETVTFLRGAALTWWRSIKQGDPAHRPTTWDEFKERIQAAFKTINSTRTARDKMARLKQTTSVRNYSTEFRNLSLDIPDMSEGDKLDRYIRGLKQEIQREVDMKEPANFEEAVRLAERLDSLLWKRDSRRFSTPAPKRFINNTNYNGPADMELGAITNPNGPGPRPANTYRGPNFQNNGYQGRRIPKLTPELRQQLIKEGRCFFCREHGHRALNCPAKKRLPNNRN